MDNPPGTAAAVERAGVSVSTERGLQIASLRYFDHAGRFAAAVREAVGGALPEPLRALQIGSATQGEAQ